MMPDDLQDFLLFCIAWFVLLSSVIYFSIRDADERLKKDGDANGD